MVAELNIVTEWLPELMEPGSIFVLENAGEVGDQEDPYWAVLSCPECGTLGLITRRQMRGLVPVICGSSTCPAQFVIIDEQVVPRRLRAGGCRVPGHFCLPRQRIASRQLLRLQS